MLVLLAAGFSASCGGQQSSQKDDGSEIDCTSGEYYDHVDDECIPKQTMDDRDGGTGTPREDAGGTEPDPDAGAPQKDSSSGKLDTGYQSGQCDKDRDRSKAISCGGNDCDDNDPRKSPDMAERCDMIDNDCSGEINDGIDCSFYAHEGKTLYKVNPLQKTARKVTSGLPDLHDIDTHPDGTLYGVAPDGFYEFQPDQKSWKQLKEFRSGASWAPEDPNGMAINRQGKVFVTSNDVLYSIIYDKKNGEKQWWVEEVGETGATNDGSKYKSSGDAVVNKRTLYMTSKHAESQDHLVTLAPTSGKASDAKPIGYKKIFGLTSAWGTLYGLTQNGELIEIDPQTGDSSLVHKFDQKWSGAASTPRRDNGGSPPSK